NLETNVGFSPAKNHSINVSMGRNYFDGWNAADDFLPTFEAQRADSGRAKQWNPKEQYFGRLQYNYKYKEMLMSYKGELFDETISNFGLPRRSTTSYVAFDDYYHTQRIDNALFLQGKFTKNWSVNWTTAYNDFERIKEARRKDLVSLRSTRIPEEPGNDQQDTSTFNLFMSRGSIANTKDSLWFNYELGYDINIENAAGKRIDGGKQELGDYAAFFSAEVRPYKNIVLKPGIRYSYNTQYETPITPSINLKYAKKNSIFRFSYAKGFRAPSLKELYFNFDDINHSLFGNADLKAERSDNYSGSVRQKFLLKGVLLKAEVSAFYNEIYNQISFAQSSIGGGDTLVYFNIGETQTKGLNINFSVIYENLQLNLGSSYIGRYNRLADENPIDEFSYSMEWIGNITYEFKKPQLTLAAFAKHQGELPRFGYNRDGEVEKQTIESYQIFDATVSRHFWKKKLNMALGCKNILDVQNVQANLSGGTHEDGSSISVGTGRTVFIRLGIKLNKK
ncbi:MAG: TonB-dependent receptor, partial [Flavobacteriales bacterium]|nr:TonB-dependent receptor [Flavobacteriales bacterium]